MEPFTTASSVRHDGWTEVRKVRFLHEVAECGNIRAACSEVGLSAEAAYRLRRRDPLFARAWAAALVLGREASAEVLECRAIDGVEEAVWYRGEIVGHRRRYDTRLLLAHMARLDAQAESGAAREDAARFDELLACIGGVAPPPELPADQDGLPLPRETCVDIAGEQAVPDTGWDDDDEHNGGEAAADGETPDWEASIEAEVAGYRQARSDAAARWDAWTLTAYAGLDRLLEADPFAEPFPHPLDGFGTPSTSSTSSAACANGALARLQTGLVATQRNV